VANDPTAKPNHELLDANPSVHPDTHTVDPSAPPVGTEGWGLTSDEQRVLSGAEQSAVQPKGVGLDPGTGQAQPTRRSGEDAASMDVSHQGRERTFRCADVGNADCRWETSSMADDEIIEEVYEHGKAVHGWKEWTDVLRNRVLDAIHERRAA